MWLVFIELPSVATKNHKTILLFKEGEKSTFIEIEQNN